jgi:hypothetical protein
MVDVPFLIRVILDHPHIFPDLKPYTHIFHNIRLVRNKSAHGEGVSDTEVGTVLDSCVLLMEVIVCAEHWPINQQLVTLSRYYLLRRTEILLATWNTKLNMPTAVENDVDIPWPALMSVAETLTASGINPDPLPGNILMSDNKVITQNHYG